MARFKIGDSIEQVRYSTVIRKGEVVAGPWKVDKVDHYHVKWAWEDPQYGTPEWFKQETDLIADLTSTKYSYR